MKTFVNLLPERLQQQQMVRRLAVRWAAAWGVCLVLGPGAYLLLRSNTRSLREEVAAAESDYARMQAAIRRGDAVRAEIRSLKERQRQFESLPNGHLPLSVLNLLGRSARSTAGQLRLETIAVREVPETEGRGGKAEGGGRRAGPDLRPPTSDIRSTTRVTVDIEGTALSDLSIGRFVASLRTSGVFASVVLKSSRGTETAKQPVRRFRLQCVFYTSPKPPAGTA